MSVFIILHMLDSKSEIIHWAKKAATTRLDVLILPQSKTLRLSSFQTYSGLFNAFKNQNGKILYGTFSKDSTFQIYELVSNGSKPQNQLLPNTLLCSKTLLSTPWSFCSAPTIFTLAKENLAKLCKAVLYHILVQPLVSEMSFLKVWNRSFPELCPWFVSNALSHCLRQVLNVKE